MRKMCVGAAEGRGSEDIDKDDEVTPILSGSLLAQGACENVKLAGEAYRGRKALGQEAKCNGDVPPIRKVGGHSARRAAKVPRGVGC